MEWNHPTLNKLSFLPFIVLLSGMRTLGAVQASVFSLRERCRNADATVRQIAHVLFFYASASHLVVVRRSPRSTPVSTVFAGVINLIMWVTPGPNHLSQSEKRNRID